jgi:hypothetical protein
MLLKHEITCFVAPEYLKRSSRDITLVWMPCIMVKGSYTILEGVIAVAGWSELVNMKALHEIGVILLLLLYLHRRAGFCMFVVEVPTMTTEKDKDVVLWHILDCS